jgi:hypothetical protein
MSLDTYQRVIDELDGAERVPADEQIRRGRANLVPVSYLLGVPRQSGDAAKGPNRCSWPQADARLEPGPLHYEPKNGRRASAYAGTRQHIKTPAYGNQHRIVHVCPRWLASARAGMLVCAESARYAPCPPLRGGASTPSAWGPADERPWRSR